MHRLYMIRSALFLVFALFFCFEINVPASEPNDSQADFDKILSDMLSPIILRGDEKTAYRDPAVVFHDHLFHLFCTKVVVEENGDIFAYTVQSKSKDLQHWSPPKTLTVRDQKRNYSSPGNVIRYGDQWILCLQTYPRPGARWQPNAPLVYADQTARLFIMRSSDLEQWSKPELLKVLGANVPEEKMGRMIDPYLVEDRKEPGKIWCFFKTAGQIGYSCTTNLTDWKYQGKTAFGENPCVIPYKNGYRLYYSPEDGIGCKDSDDLLNWKDVGPPVFLEQKDWPWAQGRLTAAFVLDLKSEPKVGKYLMFFHGSPGPTKGENWTNFDINCHIGLVWSEDLETWHWSTEKITSK